MTLVLLGFLPQTCLADGKSVFDEHKSSVVIVYVYDKDGNQINQANGFIVRKDGVIVTNYHSISNATTIKIKVKDLLLEVKGLLYIDRTNDIVMLKTEDHDFPIIKIRDADIGPEGQKTYMVGSPRDEDKILLEGTLSRIKNISPEKKLLIITAPVTKNCTGSPVFNEHGEVIGIATFFIEEAQSFYFAMPVARIKNKLSLMKITPIHKAKLKASEETAGYWFNLAAAYESLGLFTDASGAYQKVIEIDPKDALAHNNLGVVYTHLDIYSFAIREHKEAIQLKPGYQEAYLHLGMAYAKSDKPQEAIEAFEKAISLKPDDARSHNNLAVTFFKSGKFKEAIESFKQAIRIRPDYPNAYYNMGSVYYKMNMKREAIDAFQESIRLNPGLARAHFELGVIYSVHDPKSALEEYEILKNLDPYAADLLHKIIELKGNIPPEILLSSEAATEEMKQAETTVTSLGKASSPVVPASQKEGLRSPAADASESERIPSDSIDGPENTSHEETPRQSKPILKKDMYSVQVNVFENKKNALSLVKHLRGKGYDTFLKTEYRVEQPIRYLVLVGRFAERAKADKHAKIIFKKENLKSIIFKH
ncbi:MAG: hypothetical protein H6Q94_1146 [Nitrospirae bacterium]|nr:hypothetical protein [Nitrospirota bacterium]